MAKIDVAPFAGARIEICLSCQTYMYRQVAPFAGARIEIVALLILRVGSRSLPSRERGLKFKNCIELIPIEPVAPFAGARIEIFLWFSPSILQHVAPFAGARIEIEKYLLKSQSYLVAPFAGARIEILL